MSSSPPPPNEETPPPPSVPQMHLSPAQMPPRTTRRPRGHDDESASGGTLLWAALVILVFVGLGYLWFDEHSRREAIEKRYAQTFRGTGAANGSGGEGSITETMPTGPDGQPVPVSPLGTPATNLAADDLARARQTVAIEIENEAIKRLTADNLRLTTQARALAERKQVLALENAALKQQIAKNAVAVAPGLTSPPGTVSGVVDPNDIVGGGTLSPAPGTSSTVVAAPRGAGKDDETLRMGATPARAGFFGPTGPVRTVIVSRRPNLRWNALAGVTSYAIRVEEANPPRRTLASQANVSGTEWRVPEPLPRGVAYRWIVSVPGVGGAKPVLAQPAYFVVADAADARLMADSTIEYARRMNALRRKDVADPLLAEIIEGAPDLPQAQTAKSLRDAAR